MKKKSKWINDKVLLLDHEQQTRKKASNMLNYLGYEVILADDCQDVIAKYKEEIKQSGYAFDIVIIDLSKDCQSECGGCIEELRRVDPKARALATCNIADEPIIEHYKDCGFWEVLPRPIEIESLSRTLLQLI
jgi:DNA-binding NtrC family response regulator